MGDRDSELMPVVNDLGPLLLTRLLRGQNAAPSFSGQQPAQQPTQPQQQQQPSIPPALRFLPTLFNTGARIGNTLAPGTGVGPGLGLIGGLTNLGIGAAMGLNMLGPMLGLGGLGTAVAPVIAGGIGAIQQAMEPSSAWKSFGQRVGETGEHIKGGLGILTQALPQVKTQEELSGLLDTFKRYIRGERTDPTRATNDP